MVPSPTTSTSATSTSATSAPVEPIDHGNRAARPVTDITTLAQARRGARVEVVGVADGADPRVARRLFDLGFRPSAEVLVVRRAPLRDPVVYRVAGAELALRRAEAALLLVRG